MVTDPLAQDMPFHRELVRYVVQLLDYKYCEGGIRMSREYTLKVKTLDLAQ